jgi:hypothetical protein
LNCKRHDKWLPNTVFERLMKLNTERT